MSTTANDAAQPALSVTPQYKHLAPNPKSAYKQLFVEDRRIFARTIYGAFRSEECPMTPEEIAEDRDLPVEAVLEAIAYCESNPPEVEEDRRREERLMAASGMNDPNYKYKPTPRLLSPQEIVAIHRAVGKVLVQLLRRAGHDVELPVDVGLRGQHDAVQLLHAIRAVRVLFDWKSRRLRQSPQSSNPFWRLSSGNSCGS